MKKHNSLLFWLIVLVLSMDHGRLVAMDDTGTATAPGLLTQNQNPTLTLEQDLSNGKLQAARAAFQLSVNYAEESDWSNAAEMLQEAIRLQPDNTYYLHSASQLAFKLKDFEAAEIFHSRVIALHAKQHGQDNQQFVKMMDELTSIYLVENHYLDAETSLEKTLLVREKILVENHPDIALNLYWLGKVNLRLGDLERAALQLGKALEILNLSDVNQDSNAAFVLNSMGDLYQVKKEYLKAEITYQQAIALWNKEPEHNKHELSVIEKKLNTLDLVQKRLGSQEKQAGALQESSIKL